MKNLKSFIAVVCVLAASVLATTSIAEASPVGGAKYTADNVASHTTDVYDILIRGGEYTHISFSGDGDTDVDCSVYDRAGNLVVQDLNPKDECRMQVYSPVTTMISIRLKNLGAMSNNYTLVVR